MAWVRASIALLGAVALGLVLVSGGSGADPRTPPALPGLPAPFLGTALAGSGGPVAAVDAYGDVVDLRWPGPAGRALIDNPSARQAAGSVSPETGIVPWVRIGSGLWLPPWRAEAVTQRYLPGTNVVRTVARFGQVRTVMTVAAGPVVAVSGRVAGGGDRVALRLRIETRLRDDCSEEEWGNGAVLVCRGGPGRAPSATSDAVRSTGDGNTTRSEGLKALGGKAGPGGSLRNEAEALQRRAAQADRRWLARARPLGPGAPAWARAMYSRSLLTLRALSDRRGGAVAAGARDGWAYVWPRDAATAALALGAAGYRGEACRVAGFLSRLDLGAAARFNADGEPAPGRAAQGDAAGWVAAARAGGAAARTGAGGRDPVSSGTACRLLTPIGSKKRPAPRAASSWRGRADYRESSTGEFLGNAIAAGAPLSPFQTPRGLVRTAGDPGSGLDAAAAWAVRPFPRPAFYPAVRRTLLRLAATRTRFGITPGEGWPGTYPWMAPTAWTAWGLAALADSDARLRGRADSARRERREALRLLADLRRAATPAGDLPERVGARTGIPRSTTPLAWPHAFAILALRELWTPRRERSRD